MQDKQTLLPETLPQTNNKKPYKKPRLEVLGDLRTVTLGGSVGMDESGTRFPISHNYPIGPGEPLPPEY